MSRTSFKHLVDKVTGYWIYKSGYLPIGADLRIDITRKAAYPNLNIIFDVGANHGQTYTKFRSDFPGAAIYSFEPVAESFTELRSKMRGDRNATPEQLAFGETVGEKTIRLFDRSTELNSLRDDLMNSAIDARLETVRVDSIDNYCASNSIPRIDLLKIDTEGYELPILRGAIRNLQAANIAFLLCEVGFTQDNSRNTNFSELTEFLAALHYSFFGLYDVSHYWNENITFANALFVHESVMKPRR